MRPLTAKQTVKILMKNGFMLSRRRGSHQIYRNKTGVIVVVPLHNGNKPIPIGTFLAIVKQSKVQKSEFFNG